MRRRPTPARRRHPVHQLHQQSKTHMPTKALTRLDSCPDRRGDNFTTRPDGSRAHTTHGKSGSKLYEVWNAMRQRCRNPRCHAYKGYGAKGITVCREWVDDFAEFQLWALGAGYAEGLHLDRKDNEAGYSPHNCRWASPLDSWRHKLANKLSMEVATSVRYIHEMFKTPPKLLALALGVSRATIYSILQRRSWK